MYSASAASVCSCATSNHRAHMTWPIVTLNPVPRMPSSMSRSRWAPRAALNVTISILRSGASSIDAIATSYDQVANAAAYAASDWAATMTAT
jgi:hypothetical protein